jgi:type II secretory pathway component PulF
MSALYDLSNNPEDPKMGTVAGEIYRRLERGSSLEEALRAFPRIFGNLYVGSVKSGETTGNLAEVLKYLSKYLEWQGELRSQVIQAMMYPAILLVAISSAVILLVTFVFPKFVGIFKGLNIELPITTKFLIWLSEFIKVQWRGIIIGIILFIVAIWRIIHTRQGRYLFDKLKLHLPIFGILIKKVCVSRFAHTFSMALKAGIDVIRALVLCESVVGNKVIESELSSVREKVNMGENLANAFKDTKEFPPLVMRMVSVGETSGSLEATIAKVSEYYDSEVPKTISRVFALMEPALLVIMGMGVGFIAFSIFVPMFNMVNVAQLH